MWRQSLVRPLSEDDAIVLNALVGPVVIAMENARLHARVQELALTDGLTNLFNRRAFDQMLSSEITRAARYSFPLSLVIIDMDSFKAFNDRFGHLAGDERLREVAALLRSGLRTPDIVARYGGEEFALILPSTTKESAILLAERLRAAAEQCAPENCVPENFAPESRALERCENKAAIAGYTISIGVAAYPEDGQTVYELLYAADQAEMTAKKLGKNCVYPAA